MELEPKSARQWNRRAMLAAVAAGGGALAACGKEKPLEFPVTVPGGWTLGTRQQMAAAGAAQELLLSGLLSWWQATYNGPAYPTVQMYEMKTAASAFEMVQKHRSAKGMIALSIGRAFFTMQTFRGTMAELNQFASAFEKAF